MKLIQLWRRLRALGRMGRQEKMRIELHRAGELEVSGRIYCWCNRCEADRRIWCVNGGEQIQGWRGRYGMLPPD